MADRNFEAYMDRLHRRLSRYIPPRSGWTPADEALFGPSDPFRLHPAEAEALQLAAVRHAFDRHYRLNATYGAYCREHGVSPDDVRRVEDLERIPLLSDRFFKDAPEGRDFALWLAGVHTGDLPRVVIRSRRPDRDEVVRAFNAAGLGVTFSSGTSGRLTFIPRDRKDLDNAGFALAKALAAIGYPRWSPDVRGCLLMPAPAGTNLFAGRICAPYFEGVDEAWTAVDLPLTAGMVGRAMSPAGGLRTSLLRCLGRLANWRALGRVRRWLEAARAKDLRFNLAGPPFLLHALMNRIVESGRTFSFGDRGGIVSGGGWKIREGARLAGGDFRRLAGEALGIGPSRCLDVYAMVEACGSMVQCPEGHYLHVPHAYFRPMVLDESFRPLGYGRRGRFAFLDGLALSYPGFIATGDEVTLLERCPACDRTGPVVEPEIARLAGEDTRGCGEELRRIMAAGAGA